MSFAASVLLALDEGRALAESLMLDTGTVSYETGRMTQNEATGAEEPEYAIRFASKCKFPPPSTIAESDVSVGGRRAVVGAIRVDFPWNCPEVFAGDIVTASAIAPTSSPILLGRKFIVGAPMGGTFVTATRLNVKEKP